MLTVQEILEKKENICLCAKAFRQDANTLMQELADTFHFTINDCGAWPGPVYKTRHNNKGILNPEWTFYFHGSHCRFENIQTGQVVEVLFTEKPEFGYLNGFFFYNYMRTTARFKNLANWFGTYLNVYHAMDVLVVAGAFTKSSNNKQKNNIIAV
jgi:hypothetical protein